MDNKLFKNRLIFYPLLLNRHILLLSSLSPSYSPSSPFSLLVPILFLSFSTRYPKPLRCLFSSLRSPLSSSAPPNPTCDEFCDQNAIPNIKAFLELQVRTRRDPGSYPGRYDETRKKTQNICYWSHPDTQTGKSRIQTSKQPPQGWDIKWDVFQPERFTTCCKSPVTLRPH